MYVIDDVVPVPPIITGAVISVVNVGEVPNTATPVPVSSVTAVRKLALEGVANHVATPVPSPVIEPIDGVTVVLETEVINPFPFTTKVGV